VIDATQAAIFVERIGENMIQINVNKCNKLLENAQRQSITHREKAHARIKLPGKCGTSRFTHMIFSKR
jgi:hypothetical protein